MNTLQEKAKPFGPLESRRTRHGAGMGVSIWMQGHRWLLRRSRACCRDAEHAGGGTYWQFATAQSLSPRVLHVQHTQGSGTKAAALLMTRWLVQGPRLVRPRQGALPVRSALCEVLMHDEPNVACTLACVACLM